MMIRAALAVAAKTLSVGVAVPAQATIAHDSSDSRTTTRVRAAVKALPVAKSSHAGSYDREKDFGEWIDQGAGCDTRAVVLKVESWKRTTQNPNCTVETGRWLSYYNDTTYTKASRLQIDHTVPVEDAWISGAWRWNHATRVRYYNDLGDARTLVAVDTHDNESKGDQDPSTWVPPDGDCRYLRYWVAVKTRWSLTVTRAEKASLTRLAAECPNRRLAVVKATIHPR